MTFRKLLLVGAACALATSSFAQNSNVRKATRELENASIEAGNQNQGAVLLALQKAKAAIDTAIVNPKTKDDPKTWLTRASVYISLQGNEQMNADRPYLVSYDALKKTFALDNKYASKSEAIPIIINTASYAFNDGINDFNNSKYDNSLSGLSKVLDLLGEQEDKRFSEHALVDTIRAQALMISGYAAHYSDKDKDAVRFLEACTDNKYLKGNEGNIYLVLSQSYEKLGEKDKQLAVIEKGLEEVPGDENLKNAELNYYISSGDTKALVDKFKQRIEKDPNNPQLYFNLGILYDQLAQPKSEEGAIDEAYAQKAEESLNKAIELSPDDPQINYQLAAHYYNQAAAVNNIMSQMTGSDQAKYNKLEKQRDELFSKALPLLEKAKSIYQPKAASLTGDDHKFYVQSLQALAQIYTIQNKLDKAKELRALLDEL